MSPLKLISDLFLYMNEFNNLLLKMPMLYIKCKTCGVEFPSGIRVSLATLHLENKTHVCINGHANGYAQEDYYLKH